MNKIILINLTIAIVCVACFALFLYLKEIAKFNEPRMLEEQKRYEAFLKDNWHSKNNPEFPNS